MLQLGLKGTVPNTVGRAVDGREIVVYGRHSVPLQATDSEGHTVLYQQELLATDIEGFDVILGMNWLKRLDPIINFRDGTWTIRKGRQEDPVSPSISVQPHGVVPVRIQRVLVRDLEPQPDEQMYVMWYRPTSTLHSSLESSEERNVAARTIHTNALESLPHAYSDFVDVASDPGEQGLPPTSRAEHAIELLPGKTAPFGPLYPLSGRELEALRIYLNDALEKGWIQKSESSAGAPILFVPKKDGTLRLCVDYRGLNKVTIKNRYPLPLINEILDRLSGAIVFTKLDLRDAYHRLPIKPSDRWKTAFRTRYGQFEYLVMPFGLTNAPATFQSYINGALHGLVDVSCIVYMDDILIYSGNCEEHELHVKAVLQRLREYGLFIKLSKCLFHVNEVEFLGFIVGTQGIAMDQARVQAVQEWPTPNTHHDIQVFLGFTNFYRGFIRDYSKITAPITELLKGMQNGRKTGPLDWTVKATRAFDQLKLRFQEAPLLRHFDPEQELRLETDASGTGIGGVLSQPFDGGDGTLTWRPIAFLSKKFSSEQTRYSVGDQEMLAIVKAFEEWRHYLDTPSKTVTVITDHEALTKFMDNKKLARKRQTRWAEFLAAFDFTIQWRAGKRTLPMVSQGDPISKTRGQPWLGKTPSMS